MIELILKFIIAIICIWSVCWLSDICFLVTQKKYYDRLMLIAVLLLIFAFVFILDIFRNL
ncbi:MAG: hypothetical protein LBJ63_07640 [Prevotellaceae bacterium]|jgi:hypothetical protein|nr:hypothetical protein [Prevotellaceae bacterium]